MSDIELATIVAGLVAAIRRKFPVVDGPLVWVLVACVACIVCLIYLPGNWRESLLRSARVTVEAIAGASLGGYLAGKAAPVLIGMADVSDGALDRDSPTRPDLPSLHPDKSIPPPTP